MNLNSFRLKLALLTGLMAGVLLVAAGGVLWRISFRFNLDRLDHELRNLGQANLDRVQGGEHWVRLEEALKFVAGNRPGPVFVLWVKNYDKVVYESPGWPVGLDPEEFSLPGRYEGPNAPPPGGPLPPPPRRGEQISPQNPALPLKAPLFRTRDAAGKPWRVGVMGNPYATLILAEDMGDFNDRMTELRDAFLLALLSVLALVAGGAWLVAGRALRPVVALTQAAERITARGLDQRIPAMSREPEFNRLVAVFNDMLARLEMSFQQATRFSADASHELKTPLTRLQLELEQALEAAPGDSPQQEVFSSLLDEVCRLKAIIQKLLLLALADAGQLKLKLEPVDLSRLLGNVIEDCREQAPGLTVTASLAPGANSLADPELLEQALQNLAGNAVKYNQPGGSIYWELMREPGHFLIRVANTGPGIPAADRSRIFERFFRADRSRSQRAGGVGLGLSLAREIIRAHGGELSLEDQDDGRTRFMVRLPAE